jgi:hypothetical protein
MAIAIQHCLSLAWIKSLFYNYGKDELAFADGFLWLLHI